MSSKRKSLWQFFEIFYWNRGDLVAYKIINCGDHRQRRSFSKIKNTYELTDLLEIQKKSYQWFVETGIKEVFEDLFPVENFSGTLSSTKWAY